MAKPIPANILREQKTLKDSRELKSGQENFYRIWQSYASPYSYKVMTFMNYKGIPYKRMEADLNANMSEIPRLVGQSIIPVILTPDEQVMQDSTPILEHFEKQYPEKTTVPEDKRLEFIMWVLEEFSDEYMPRIHMHTRWGNEQNRQTISHRIARGVAFGSPSAKTSDMAKFLLSRQSGFDKHLGLSGDNIRANMDQQILDLLEILEAHFKEHQFLLGFKPSMADFALFGPLKVHLFNDPQSNEIMEINGPRTCRWLDTISELGDTRGCAGQTEFGDWINLDDGLPESLEKILGFVSKTYFPFAKACALAGKDRNKTFTATVYGEEATFSVHQYRVWSFEQLQLKYQALTGQDKHFIDEVLTASQILPKFMEGEIVHNALYDGFTPPFIKDGIADARAKHLKSKGAKVTGV
ncbi:MAG: glutathione S-transferase family protein [Bermanella sp.]